MKVSVTARHFDLTPDLRDHAEARLSRFHKYTNGLMSANVVLEVQKYHHIAEVSVHARHGDYTAKAVADDFTSAIDSACDKVERQIRRNARKLRSHNSNNGEPKELSAMGETRIQSEQKNREMMTLDEATTRVEEGEEIVIFADTDSGATRVVYRRPDGSMKLIEVAG